MTPAFNTADPRTWCETLGADEVAEIFGRKVLGLKKSCQDRAFIPAPFQRHPYRWRKSDVLRHLGVSRQRVSA